MPNRTSATLQIREALNLWQDTAFGDPPPAQLVQLVHDQVRQAIAAQFAASDEKQPIQPDLVEADVVSAVGAEVRGHAAEALARLVRAAVQDIAVIGEPQEVTRMLWAWKGSAGDQTDKKRIEEELFRALYSYLYHLAARKLFGSARLRHKIDPAELLSELYMRLSKAEIPHLWANRRQFHAMAGTALHNILKDLFKASDRLKRPKTNLGTAIKTAHHPAAPATEVDYFACREALERLGEISARQKEVVELGWLWGLTVPEIAEELGVSEMTIKRDNKLARAHLRKLLGHDA